MEIKIELSVGELGYFMYSNRIKEEEVIKILTQSSFNGFGITKTIITYIFKIEGAEKMIDSSFVFKNREDLLNSL